MLEQVEHKLSAIWILTEKHPTKIGNIPDPLVSLTKMNIVFSHDGFCVPAQSPFSRLTSNIGAWISTFNKSSSTFSSRRMTTPVVASKGDVEWDLTIESAGFCCLFFFHDCVECPQADFMWRLGVQCVSAIISTCCYPVRGSQLPKIIGTALAGSWVTFENYLEISTHVNRSVQHMHWFI